MPEKIVMTFHEKFKQYDLGEGHPFRGDRFANVRRFFEEQGLLSLSEVILVEPQSASKQDLLRVHEENYVDLIFRLAEQNKPYDVETPVSDEILEAALLIVAVQFLAANRFIRERQNVEFLWVGVIIMLEEVMVADSACSTTWQFWLSI